MKPWTRPGFCPTSKGVAVHDHWAPYWRYTGCEHVLCNAHHLRELNYSDELTGHLWPRLLRESLLQANEAVAQAKEQGLTHLPRDQILAYPHEIMQGSQRRTLPVSSSGSVVRCHR
ncbi:IS66 family transposase [Ectothiorhodospira variabilis]|uniref:IS66 family transposase n=1 Tax=Ectothiorhodospira variabilis TaxID=505694 RepID=UPI003B75C140